MGDWLCLGRPVERPSTHVVHMTQRDTLVVVARVVADVGLLSKSRMFQTSLH